MNEAMLQGYYSITQYSSFNHKYYIRFLEETKAQSAEIQTREEMGNKTRSPSHNDEIPVCISSRRDIYSNPIILTILIN
jgi:hypothetical protein